MVSLRSSHPAPSGLEPAPAPRRRRWPLVLAVAAVLLLALAWFDDGEEALHPIAEDVALPEAAQ